MDLRHQASRRAAADLVNALPAMKSLRRSAGGLLRQAAGVVRELRRADELVYAESQAELQAQGGPFTLHYLGRRRFAHDFWALYERSESAPKQTFRTQSNVLAFLVSRSGLQQCPVDADLLVVDQYLLPQRLGQTAATFAPFLNAHLPIDKDLEAQLTRVRSKGHRRKLAAVLKEPLSWRKSHDLADLRTWYTQMYEPFVKLRFGDDGTVVSYDDMANTFAKRGFLLLLEEAGVAVSGALMYTSRSRPNSLNYWKYALRDASSLAPNAFGERNAKTEAMVLSHTVQAGFAELDFGLTRSSPTDGIFIHKKRVGCNFRVPEGAAHFALHFAANVQARVLCRYPMIVQSSDGMQAWLGQHGELDFSASRRLRDTLLACSFGSLGAVKLFHSGVSDSRDKLSQLALAATDELGCPITLHEV